ncbi:MAG: recombinase family protein, partial [Oscillospiraceae bacterium]|nr:recombinase family protein [Oscillospiraceae bacterium]
MEKAKLRVYGYVRVSTENQLENYSIEEQTERIKAYCAAKDWVLLHTYIDGGYSGGNTNRPALQQMLEAVKDRLADAVVVYKLDRLSRSQKDTLTLIEDSLLSNGTDFISINENFDTSTPFGRAMIGILSVFAQLEKDQITERFTMGRIGRSKAGYFHGGANPPTGYDYKDGLLVVNEYEAMQVRELFEGFAAGRSVNAIANDLNRRYTTAWNPAKAVSVLRNSVYIGKVHFRKTEYPGVHKPLIDEELFREANRLLSSQEREDRKNAAQKTPYRAGYLLSGLVVCGRCGARYSAAHGYYVCYSRSKTNRKYIADPNCMNDKWKIPELDEVVCRYVQKMVSQTDILDFIASVSEEKRRNINDESIRNRVHEVDGQIIKLLDLYQIGSIPM